MISMEEYRKPDGKVDWPALRKAEIENGDLCCECGKYLARGSGRRERCGECGKTSEMTTHVSYTFSSPAVVGKAEDEDAPPED